MPWRHTNTSTFMAISRYVTYGVRSRPVLSSPIGNIVSLHLQGRRGPTGPEHNPFRPSAGSACSEGLRPSDSPTRALARRFAGSLRSRGSLAALARNCGARAALGRCSKFAYSPFVQKQIRLSASATCPEEPSMWSKLLSTVCLLLAVAGSAAAQTPHALTGSPGGTDSSQVQIMGASAANSWIGAQLGYKFGDNSKELGDNLLVSASVIYEIPLTRRSFVLPVISNFSHLVANPAADTSEQKREDQLRELMLASSGVRAGVYPYRKIGVFSADDVSFIVHGETSWKLNAFKKEEIDEINYLNQMRLAAGFEIAVGKADDDHKPLTLSVTPVHTRFSATEYARIFNESKSHLNSLEVVAVVPVSGRTGVLFEYVTGTLSSFR